MSRQGPKLKPGDKVIVRQDREIKPIDFIPHKVYSVLDVQEEPPINLFKDCGVWSDLIEGDEYVLLNSSSQKWISKYYLEKV